MRRIKRGNLHPDPSSIVLHVMPVMQVRGIKYPTAFLRKLGISPTSANKLIKGEALQINLKQLTKICVALKCVPNDLFALRDMTLPAGHPLLDLEKIKPLPDLLTVEEFLGSKSVMEARGLLRR